MNIPTDILEYIDAHRICGSALQELAPRLPADDDELHAWLSEAIAHMEPEIFTMLVFAAQAAGRRMRASLFPAAINLLINPMETCAVAMHLEGDTAEAACEGMRTGAASMPTSCQLCLVAADWSMKHRDGKAPDYLHTRLYSIARSKNLTNDHRIYVLAAALILKDETLIGMLLPHFPTESAELRAKVLETSLKAGEGLLSMYAKPVMEYVTPTPNRIIATGKMPMRRAVSRIGSNDPCPCGSGKKYKRCCLEKDQMRLRMSSEVAGKTWREARTGREQFLTVDTIKKMLPADLYHMDVRKLKKEVLPWFFIIAAALQQFDTCARAFPTLGWDAENKILRDGWMECVFLAGMSNRPDAVETLRNALPDPAEADALMEPIGSLLYTARDPAAHLAMLEKVAREALGVTETRELQKAALGLLHCACPSLGILAARGFIPLLPRTDAEFILQQILETRDRLHLPPDDAFSEVLERRFASEVTSEDRNSEATRRVRRQIEAKASEVRNLRTQLDHLHRELEKKERKARSSAPAPSGSQSQPAAPAPDESIKDLRRKVGELKYLLQQRQDERSTLRSELEKAHSELEKTRAAAAPAPAIPAVDDNEDALLLPAEPGTTQPVRLPSFPRHFLDTLHTLPRHIARHALETIGSLCGGEPSAFHGVVRLKALPAVFRIRIGIDHRLLFRLSGETLEVVELINRRDLEKRIRVLAS